jgi:elongation factor G
MIRIAYICIHRNLPGVAKSARGTYINFLPPCRCKASLATSSDDSMFSADDSTSSARINAEIQRLKHIRNVGVFAHVDAGKTTVTERMLALAGVVARAGSVDDGNTVTDYLPAERERGITIQSAAISFDWGWHNNSNQSRDSSVKISLIDTPGHVDFSVEVNRSVAVLDGAVLVVDAVAGVQAQTETVWRAMTRPSLNNHDAASAEAALSSQFQDHGHEPLPCLALINKMDKDGRHFGSAIESLRQKLPGANPIPIHLPLFRLDSKVQSSSIFPDGLSAYPIESSVDIGSSGEFVGVVDLVHMNAVIWPAKSSVSNVEECVPSVFPLMEPGTRVPIDRDCPITQEALNARATLIERIADFDENIEEYYLKEQEPSNPELRFALRRATLAQRALPVLAGAALRGRGVELVLDAIADLLPSPLDRSPPALLNLHSSERAAAVTDEKRASRVPLGHPLHPSGLLAFAFKVVHMKGRGGSGDGRVVFVRVYSGELRERDSIHIVAPPRPGEAPGQPRLERIGAMLELAGGDFGRLEDGVCRSGDVCALVGLKSVTTGDTIVAVPDRSKTKKLQTTNSSVCLAGVAAPRPVLKVRLEAETAGLHARLSQALALLAVEDPSLVVEETDTSTLLSGLGELHIEVTVDRLVREFGVQVHVGEPSVAYRETVVDNIETKGLHIYDRSVGGTRMQAAVHLLLKPLWKCAGSNDSSCTTLAEPTVSVSDNVIAFLGLDPNMTADELMVRSELYKALVQGSLGALRRGSLSSFALANVKCYIVEVDADGGLSSLLAMPGALRAASANAVSTLLSDNQRFCTILEPTMSIEISLPSDIVGTVMSDLSSRRGNVGDVIVGGSQNLGVPKALIRGEVPLAQILGYASVLRSITGGEGSFTAEYKGHSPSSPLSLR